MNEPGALRESRSRVEKLVGQLIELSRDETACRVLGVDGAVAEHVDILFLEDTVDYVAYDIASALMAADATFESPTEVPPMLTELVAEVRLCEALQGRLDEAELVRRTLGYLRE